MQLKQPALFITGTDTGVGKTFYSCKLLQALNTAGYSTLAMKPVAAGAELQQGIYRNDDALQLQRLASVKTAYAEVNPYCFPLAVAPHIAAAEAGQVIELDSLRDQFKKLQEKADFVLVEGVGGWQVPLNDEATVANLAEILQLPVVLVVGMRLGCINHALLTANSIQQSSVPLMGWIANLPETAMPALNQNIETLKRMISAPLLDIIQHQNASSDSVVSSLQLDWLQNTLQKKI